MISGPKPGDEDDTRLHLVYDAWNRLAKVRADSGGSPADTIAEYAYDGLNRRVAKVVADGQDNWDRTDYYYNEQWQVLEERQARDVDDEDRLDPAEDVYCQYVWDLRYIDAPTSP